MARGHWLDPLARGLLEAAGQLPRRAQASPEQRVEQDLLELKLQLDPQLRLSSSEDVRHAAALGWRLDVNRATASDWLRLPQIQARQVDLLLRLQQGGVQLSGPEDLQKLLEISEDLVRSWEPLLQFRWYGDGAPAAITPVKLDLNRASRSSLERQLPQLNAERRQRLLRERQRAPFQDLADLQQRLQLPAAVIEELIGKVRFGQGPAGPELPRSA
jgi:DNA uptake protein ComE-like DNA-binding protein